MTKKPTGYLLVALVLLAWCAPVSADVIGLGGSACFLPVAPASWAPGALEDDTCINGFYLMRDIVPGAAITLNLTQTGYQDYGDPIMPGPEVTFGAGAAFDIFLVTLDPVGIAGSLFLEGTFTFDQRIIMLATSWDSEIYGPPDGGDYSILSADRNELFLSFWAGPHVDQLVVVTTNAEPVPEPASLLLFGTGLVVLGAWRKWRP